MKRITVELLLTDAEVEGARLQSAKVGKPGEFDAQGLHATGLVDLTPDRITIDHTLTETVNGVFGVESWTGHAPVGNTRTTWHDTAAEQRDTAHRALKDGRSVRLVSPKERP